MSDKRLSETDFPRAGQVSCKRGNSCAAQCTSLVRSGAAPLVGQRQDGAGEFALLRTRFHYRREDDDLHTEGGDRGGLRFIHGVNDEGAGEVRVEFGDAEGCGVVAELSEHLVGGALEGFSADDGADGEDFLFVRAQMLANTWDGENRADADERIAGADD